MSCHERKTGVLTKEKNRSTSAGLIYNDNDDSCCSHFSVEPTSNLGEMQEKNDFHCKFVSEQSKGVSSCERLTTSTPQLEHVQGRVIEEDISRLTDSIGIYDSLLALPDKEKSVEKQEGNISNIPQNETREIVIDKSIKNMRKSVDINTMQKKLKKTLSSKTKKEVVDVALKINDKCQLYQIKYTNLLEYNGSLDSSKLFVEQTKEHNCRKKEELIKLIECSAYKEEENMDTLYKSIKYLREENSKLSEKINQLEKKGDEIVSEKNSEMDTIKNNFAMQTQLKDHLQEKVSGLIKEVEYLKTEAIVQEGNYTLNGLQKLLDDGKNVASQQRDNEEKLIERINKLNKEFEIAKDELEIKNSFLTNEISALTKTTIDIHKAMEELVAEKENLGSETKELKDKVIELEKSLEARNVSNIDLLDKNRNLSNRISELETVKNDALDKNSFYVNEIIQLRMSIDNDNQILDKLIKEKETLASETNELLIEITEVNKSVSNLIQERSKMISEKGDLNNQITKLETENKKLLDDNIGCFKMSRSFDKDITVTNLLHLLSSDKLKDGKNIFMKDSILKWFENDCNIDFKDVSLYENIILDLQDSLDFYQQFTGLSVWKSKFVNVDNNFLERCDIFIEYYCQFNDKIKNGIYDGYRFSIILDYENKEITYSPDSSILNSSLPPTLLKEAKFSLSSSCMFLKTLLE